MTSISFAETLEMNCIRFPELKGATEILNANAAANRHGDWPRWQAALGSLPQAPDTTLTYGPCPKISGELSNSDRAQLRKVLQVFRPWRKGPFDLLGVHIDSEWRSDFKWQRLADHLQVAHHRILDVGCGNGYFGWRLLEAGAKAVLGVDPTLLFNLQHLVINHYAQSANHAVIPLRFEDLPACQFDTVLSMGVVYHRRDPQAHVQQLFQHTRPGGQLVLESLVVQSEHSLIPAERYARMRNVWCIPTITAMKEWMVQAGYKAIRLIDVTATRQNEQRATDWMTFDSLESALDAQDPSRTVEGYPAPVRAILIGQRPESTTDTVHSSNRSTGN